MNIHSLSKVKIAFVIIITTSAFLGYLSLQKPSPPMIKNHLNLAVLTIPGGELSSIIHGNGSVWELIDLIRLGRNSISNHPHIEYKKELYIGNNPNEAGVISGSLFGNMIGMVLEGSGDPLDNAIREVSVPLSHGNFNGVTSTEGPGSPQPYTVSTDTIVGGSTVHQCNNCVATAPPIAPTPQTTSEVAGSATDNSVSVSDDNDIPAPQKYTATISYPTEYSLNERFVVTLAVIKGEKPIITLQKTLEADISGNKVENQYPLMAPTKRMQATLWYDNNRQESRQPPRQRISSKYSTLWTWVIVPDTTGVHYININLNTLLPDDQPNVHQPFYHKIEVTESLWSQIKRIITLWLTPEWIKVNWLWTTILAPIGAFIIWKIRVWRRAFNRKQKLATEVGKDFSA